MVHERMSRMPFALLADAEFQIPSHGRYVALVRKGIRSLAAGAGFDKAECQDIEVAIGEAVTNAVCHGRPAEGAGRVHVHCSLAHGHLAVEIEDEGGATCLPLPKANPTATDEHGRGWYLMHRLMDQVSVRCTEKGLLVRMAKRHRSARKTGKLRALDFAALL
jgi:serine/threonine-protein kinase RsbW